MSNVNLLQGLMGLITERQGARKVNTQETMAKIEKLTTALQDSSEYTHFLGELKIALSKIADELEFDPETQLNETQARSILEGLAQNLNRANKAHSAYAFAKKIGVI